MLHQQNINNSFNTGIYSYILNYLRHNILPIFSARFSKTNTLYRYVCMYEIHTVELSFFNKTIQDYGLLF